jgi:hypothetical protein
MSIWNKTGSIKPETAVVWVGIFPALIGGGLGVRTAQGDLDFLFKKSELIASVEESIPQPEYRFDLESYIKQIEGPGVDTSAPIMQRPEIFNGMGYEPVNSERLRGLNYAPKGTLHGNLQRALAAQPLFEAVASKRPITASLLAAIAIHENYSDAVQANTSGDGGLGHGQLQGRTAQNLELRTVSHSGQYQDFRLGIEIDKLLKRCNYDERCTHREDERTHPLKALDGIARIHEIGQAMYGNEGLAIQSHRGFVNQKIGKNYEDEVRRWQRIIQDPSAIADAYADLFQRNPGLTYPSFQSMAKDTARNWGKGTYTGQIDRIKLPAYAKNALEFSDK